VTTEAYSDHIAYLQKATEAALAKHQFEALVLCSGAAQAKNRFDDQSWPLSPTPAYSHWCPLAEPDSFVVIRPGRRPTLVRTVADDYWETPAPPESDHFWTSFDVVTVGPGHAGDVLPGGKVAVITRDPGQAPPGEVNPAQLITTLDTPQPQVEIEARIVQVSKTYARALGVQWGFNGRVDPALGNTTPLAFPNSGSLSGLCAALSAGFGVAAHSSRLIPPGLTRLSPEIEMPSLPEVEFVAIGPGRSHRLAMRMVDTLVDNPETLQRVGSE